MTEVVEDSLSARVEIGDGDYELIEMETDISRYSETDRVTLVVVDRDFNQEPSSNETVRVWINGEKIFEGFVNRVKFKDDGSFEVQVFNDLYETKNSTVSISSTETVISISAAVEDVCQAAGVEYNIDLRWYTEIPDEEIEELVVNAGEEIITEFELPGLVTPAVDYYVTIEETNTKCAKVLDKLAKWSNSDWWFDNDNVLQFGLPDSQLHDVEYIINSDASDLLPPYRGVRVVGDNIASSLGLPASHLFSDFSVTAERGVEYDEAQSTWIVSKEAVDPTFTLKDKQLKTKQQVEFAAKKLMDEIMKQIKGGTVEFVGTEDRNSAAIDALDVIRMPDRFGGERYFVGRINHKINGTDGYTVSVECEGLVPGRYGVESTVIDQ